MTHRFAHTNRNSAATQARRAKYAGREHRQAAADIRRRQSQGEWLTCWRCHHPIPPTQRAHVGHDDVMLNVIRGPEHPGCNLKAAQRKGARMRSRQVRSAPPALRAVRRRDLTN